MEQDSEIDELTFEPIPEPIGDPATGLIPESLRRREPTQTIDRRNGRL